VGRKSACMGDELSSGWSAAVFSSSVHAFWLPFSEALLDAAVAEETQVGSCLHIS
jgi:hypothetical protein